MTVECTARGPASKDAYVLGRSARELDRLDLQGIIYRYMAESVRSMLPMADSHEIGGFSPESVEQLEANLRDELVESGGVLVCWPVVSAWCRLASTQP